MTLAELVAALEARDRAGAPGSTASPMQPGDVPVTFAAVEKAERLLGFRARVPLAEGLEAVGGVVSADRAAAAHRRAERGA